MRFITNLHRQRALTGQARAARNVIYPVARIPQKWIPALRNNTRPQIGKSIYRGKPDTTLPKHALCADLALLYGKAGALSPVCRIFWSFLAGSGGP
jgi:hypothetical protein